MRTKSFSLTSVVTLSGIALFVGAAAACGGSDEVTPADAGAGDASVDASSNQGPTGDDAGTDGTADLNEAAKKAGLRDPATVPGEVIPFQKCDEFKKCDGSIKGDWKVVGGCLPDNTFDSYKSFCPGLVAHDVVIKASGTVSATESPNVVIQKTSIFLQAFVDVPVKCTSLLGGSCDVVPGLLMGGGTGGSKFDHAVCITAGDTCKCAGDVTVVEDTSDQYSLSGDGTLSTGTDPKRTYDYCPADGKITYHETTKQNKTFGMFLTIGSK